MFKPTISLATTAINAVGSAVQHTIVDTTLAVPTQLWSYVVGNKYPSSVPSVEACLQAWVTGWLDTADTAAVCRWQGADVPLPGRLRADASLGENSLLMQRAWDSTLNSMQGVVTTDGCIELWLRGIIGDEELKEWLRRNGIVRDDVRDGLKALAQSVPEATDIVPAWKFGLVTDEQARDLLARRGIDFDTFQPFFYASSDRISPHEAIEYARRNGFDEENTRDMLRRSGVFDTFQQSAAMTLYDQLPTRIDVQQWLMRNVFDQSYVDDFRLAEGFEERYWARFETILTAGGWSKDYAYLDYAAHWIVPGVGQLAEMVQRLRPGRVDNSLVFTPSDFSRVLAEQDVAPFFRERLLYTAYRVAPLRFVRNAFQTSVMTTEEFVNQMQDQGYSLETATTIASTEEIIKARTRATTSRGWTPQAIARAYVTRQTDAGNAAYLMQQIGYTKSETDRMLERASAEFAGRFALSGVTRLASATVSATLRAYAAGTVTSDAAIRTLVSVGYTPESSAGIIQAADLQVRTAAAAKASAAVKKAFLRGDVSEAQAVQLLLSVGIVPDRAAQQLALWKLELTPRRKHISATDIRKGYLDRLISEEQALNALTNLGYSIPDAALLAGEFVHDLAQQLTKVGKAEQKNAISAAKILDQLLASNVKLDAKIRNALRRAAPVGKLQKWLKAGLIDEAQFRHRMSQIGYSDGVTDKYVSETSIPASSRKSSPPAAPQGPQEQGASGSNA